MAAIPLTGVSQVMDRVRGCKWLMATTALCTPAVITAAMLLPKDAAYASPQRLALTGLVLVTGIGGLAGFIYARRRCHEAMLLRRVGPASSAVRDTLSYLRNEQRLARRGRLSLMIGSLSTFGLHVLAHWPQAAVLAPYRSTFGAVSLSLLAAVSVLLIRNRTHFINSWYLRRQISLQLDHLGYRPASRLKEIVAGWRRRKAPLVSVTGPGRFCINGFEWSFARDLVNVVILGQTASGKTIACLNNLLFGLLASSPRDGDLKISGLVLDAKGDFYKKLHSICAALGRSKDLVIIDPSMWERAARTWQSAAWNPLHNSDDPLEISSRLVAALKLLGLEQGNEGSFFLTSAIVCLRHAITLVRAGTVEEVPSLIDVYRLCLEGEEETPLYHKLFAAVSKRFPGELPIEIADALHYFEKEFAKMADRQKSALIGTLTQLLDEFLVMPFREMFTGASTISISDVIDQGKILYVHMPAADRERMSRLLTTLIKLEFQRHVLKRPRKSRATFMLADEFQLYFCSGEGRGDSDVFERSRESNHCNIIASQSISSLYKKTRNFADIKNLLGNCAVKIFLRNTEEETTKWASALFGMRSEIVVNSSEQAVVEGGWSKRRRTNYSRMTKMLPVVPPEALTRLAIPVKGDPRHQHAESIVHLSSRSMTEHRTLLWPVNPLE